MEYPLTIVSAPFAFGKRIAIEEAIRKAKEQGVHVKWFQSQQGKNSKYIYDVIEEQKKKSDGKWLYIFDGCKGEEWIDEFQSMRWHKIWKEDIHCVCIMSSEIPMNRVYLSHWIHSISKQDLELKERDIVKLYQLHGIKITYRAAKLLYEYSGGWPGAIMLGIREYYYQNKLVPGIGIDELLEREVFKNYDAVEKEAITSLYGFKELTMEQVIMLTGVKQEERDKIVALIERNPFISYDIIHGKYVVEDVFFHYLYRRIKKSSWLVQRKVELRRAKWYESQGQFQESIMIYEQVKAYELICQYPYKLSELYACTNRTFLEQLWSLWKKIPYHIKCKYIRFFMLIASLFFLWKETRRGSLILDEVEEIAEQILGLSGDKKEEIQGELCLIRGSKYDRDIDRVEDTYQIALQFIKGSSMIYDEEFLLTEGVPCFLHKYYKKVGTLDSLILKFRTCINTFYELTQYSNAGSSYLVEAEVEFLRGNLKEAKKLAYHGIQEAQKYGQTCIKMMGQFLLLDIFVYLGCYKTAEEYLALLEEEKEKIGRSKFQLGAELSFIHAYIRIGKVAKIPDWIWHDHSASGQHSELVNMYLNYCYLQQLLVKKEEEQIIEIGEHLFEQAYEKQFLWVAIQMKLISVIAYHRVGNEKLARECLRNVLNLTSKDQIYMPIIQYYIELLPLFQKLIHEENYQMSVQQVMELYQKLENMKQQNKDEEKLDETRYGLTKRELEIALLGAKRYRNHEIAKRLYISENTVKYNMKHIFQKLNIKSRLELKKFFK